MIKNLKGKKYKIYWALLNFVYSSKFVNQYLAYMCIAGCSDNGIYISYLCRIGQQMLKDFPT